VDDRYHQFVAAGVFEGQAVELLRRELIAMPPEDIRHDGLRQDGEDLLRQRLGKHAQIRTGQPITLPNNSGPEPDIAIVKPLGRVNRHEHAPYVEKIF
jgi:Uma2 family endonuclease